MRAPIKKIVSKTNTIAKLAPAKATNAKGHHDRVRGTADVLCWLFASQICVDRKFFQFFLFLLSFIQLYYLVWFFFAVSEKWIHKIYFSYFVLDAYFLAMYSAYRLVWTNLMLFCVLVFSYCCAWLGYYVEFSSSNSIPQPHRKWWIKKINFFTCVWKKVDELRCAQMGSFKWSN